MLIKLPVSDKNFITFRLGINTVSHVLLESKTNILETYRGSLIYVATSTIIDNLLKTLKIDKYYSQLKVQSKLTLLYAQASIIKVFKSIYLSHYSEKLYVLL